VSLIITPYEYSYLLTDEFLADKYLWQFLRKTRADHVVRTNILIRRHATKILKWKIMTLHKWLLNKQEIRSVELGVDVQCNFVIVDHVTFIQFKICCCVQNFMKIGWFLLRYGDISIFKMAAVRHLGIDLLPYETTHEVSVAGRRCLSNFMLIWYTDLKI